MLVLRAADGATKPSQTSVFADGLGYPYGIAFYPAGADPQWVYVAETNRVVRFPYKSGDLVAGGAPQTIVERLPGGGHVTRDIAFSPDGKRLYVAVGSGSNVAEGQRALPANAIPEWEAAHGLGAAWGGEEDRADVLAFDPDGGNKRVFAAGIRNCAGLAVEPKTAAVWCATNERDGLGDNLPPDYVSRIRQGAFYGWPWYYIGDNQDPRHAGERPDLAGKVTVPDVLIQAHSAPLGLTFYTAMPFRRSIAATASPPCTGRGTGRSGPATRWFAFRCKTACRPANTRISWSAWCSPTTRSGGGRWGSRWRRDGALLVSEDGNGTIWRVSAER